METAVCMDFPPQKHISAPSLSPISTKRVHNQAFPFVGWREFWADLSSLGKSLPIQQQRDIPGRKEDKRVENKAVWELFQKQIPNSSVLLLELKACK